MVAAELEGRSTRPDGGGAVDDVDSEFAATGPTPALLASEAILPCE